jgi:hypothetical protein
VPLHDVTKLVLQHSHIDILYDDLTGLAGLEHPHPPLVLGLAAATNSFASRTHSAAAILNIPADALHVKTTRSCSSFSLPKT